jgi:hypothetical protein
MGLVLGLLQGFQHGIIIPGSIHRAIPNSRRQGSLADESPCQVSVLRVANASRHALEFGAALVPQPLG